VTQRANRRPPTEQIPQGLSSLPWEQARGPIHRLFLWMIDNYSGIPGGFFGTDPTTIEPDDAADPGTESEGWAAADHTHAIAAGTPSTLGNTNTEGSASSFARSDHIHASGMTAKGDILTYASGITRLAVGSNGLPFYANSSASTGNQWGPIILSPAQITANQTDYAPGVANILRLSSDASRTIYSMAAQAGGLFILIVNVGSNNIVLAHDDGATGTAAQRFLCMGYANITLGPDDAAHGFYDATTARWRMYPL
jgi:hypothetical protein